MVTLLIYFDIKAAHDCLTSIVQELDAKGALLERKNAAIDHLYQDLTGKNEADFDRLVATLPQRMWVE
jgi:glyoxylate carboligase